MHTGWWAPQHHSCRTQCIRSWFVAWDSIVRCIGLIHSFLWQRWLTSRPASGNCDLVSLTSTIRATRFTFSTLLPSTGHPTLKIPYLSAIRMISMERENIALQLTNLLLKTSVSCAALVREMKIQYLKVWQHSWHYYTFPMFSSLNSFPPLWWHDV